MYSKFFIRKYFKHISKHEIPFFKLLTVKFCKVLFFFFTIYTECQISFKSKIDVPAIVYSHILKNTAKTYVKELCKYGTCIGLSPSRQRQATPECESQLALKDLGKLWNSAYCSLIHFCVNEKHVLNLSREIRWISLLLSVCQCRFTVSTGIIVQPIRMCITFPCQGNF